MIRKYSYEVEFFARELSPHGTKTYTATGECSLKEMKQNFQDFLAKYGYSTKGTTTSGAVIGKEGKPIGKFQFHSQTIQ